MHGSLHPIATSADCAMAAQWAAWERRSMAASGRQSETNLTV